MNDVYIFLYNLLYTVSSGLVLIPVHMPSPAFEQVLVEVEAEVGRKRENKTTMGQSTLVSTCSNDQKEMKIEGENQCCIDYVETSMRQTERCETECEDAKKIRWQDLLTKRFCRQLFAEFLGTGMIVSLGTGSVMSSIFADALLGLFQIASVWIIAVTLAIATTGPVSGAHLNPAISVAFALHRPCNGFGWIKVLPYCIAQTCGAIVFSWLNLVLYNSKISLFEAENGIIRGSENGVMSARAFGEYFE